MRYTHFIIIFTILTVIWVVPVSGWYVVGTDGYGLNTIGGTPPAFTPGIITSISGHTCFYQVGSPAVGQGLGYINSYPATYWSFVYTGGSTFNPRWYDISGGVITYFTTYFGATEPALIECYRVYNSTTSEYDYSLYVDDVYQQVSSTSNGSVPYYFNSGAFSTNVVKGDMFVYGDTEERDLVGLPPNNYFIAKDMITPAFSGVYSAPDTQYSPTEFEVLYRQNTINSTIILKNVATGYIAVSDIIPDPAGYYIFNLTEFFADSDADYGIYSCYIDGSSQSMQIAYTAIATSGTYTIWDDETYEQDDIATITYSIAESYWDTSSYEYYLKIESQDLTDLDSWELTTRPIGNATQEVTIDTDTFPVDGYYYTTLYAVDRSSSEEILLSYDSAYVDVESASGTVIVSGTTYDAINSTVLGSCTVIATQFGSSNSVISNVIDGSYSVTGLTTDFSIGMNASKTNWRGFPTYFTPYESGTYTVDIPLVPWVDGAAVPGTWEVVSGGWATQDSSSSTTTDYWNATTDGTGLGGIIYNEPYWTITSGATVTVSNATFNATKTTGDGGWYQFNETVDGICGGTYTITVSKTGYSTVTTTTTLVEDEFTRKDLCLGTNFTLTVNCRELTSNALITDSDVYVELDTGDSTTTTTGIATFSDVEYGVVGITASAVGYYPGTGSVVVDSTTITTVYLQKEAEASAPTNSSGFGVGYAPKTVRFTVQTIWGKPIENCLVNATGYETTVGDWDWLYKVFGIDVNETPIATCTMGGYTDYKGDINFVMLEPVQYNCSFVKAGEINTTMSIYPKDDYYMVYATDFGNTSWLEGGSDINEAVSVNVTKGDDGSTGWINISYTDTSGGTTGGTCYLNQTNPADPDGDETVVDSYVIATNNWSKNYTALAIDGEAYHVHVDPVHSTWDFERSYVVNFPKEKVNPLGLSDQELMILATFLILFTGLLFGAISAPHAPLIMSFMGWIFLALGWLDAMLLTATAALTLATVLSVLTLVMVRSKKERFI